VDLTDVYRRRFPAEDLAAKSAIWRVLCADFFQRYVPLESTVLDLGAGYCEFLQHIRCAQKIAVDLNPDVSRFAPPGTQTILAPSHDLHDFVNDQSVDVVFASNFFEHLPDKVIFLKTLAEMHRILRVGGRLLVLQPNIRAVGGSYWDFVDHHLPLNDRSLAEAVEMVGFKVEQVWPRFLPYTTRSKIPQHPFLVRLYLRVPLAWRIMGGQTWLVASR
jgi:SAM-dependent methyltransferase